LVVVRRAREGRDGVHGLVHPFIEWPLVPFRSPFRLGGVGHNAGYGHFGAIEEVTEEEARAQMETNFFGALWITQAAIPLLREQGGGHIVQVSSPK
jgi:NAD(P)-dependent dehydrogenase (short-subunit alcohol dehydrogenase family)